MTLFSYRNMLLLVAALFLASVMPLACGEDVPAAKPAESDTAGKVVETPICSFEWGGDVPDVTVSDDGQRFLFTSRKRPHEWYERAVLFDASSGSKHEFYMVYEIPASIPKTVIDDEQYPTGSARFLAFSPDLRHYAAAAMDEDHKCAVIIDGVKDNKYTDAHSALYSTDSKRLAYAARKVDKWVVVLDGIEGGEHDKVTSLAFSQDSRHFTYTATKDGKHFLVTDGVEQEQQAGAAAPDAGE
jgi:WD40 repeat protein